MKIIQVIEWEIDDQFEPIAEEVIWGEFREYAPDSGVRMLTSDMSVVN